MIYKRKTQIQEAPLIFVDLENFFWEYQDIGRKANYLV